ncbi:MAG: RagB/SusD family nutrient uptake outer membrane protein [Tannerella sp.]|jgi:hypothetical protein|nr:RagB/SusD family nutrient uptake outer membrane protein [Tannerella sp.]
MKNIIKLLVIIPFLFSCEDVFEPAMENFRTVESLYNEPSFAQGLLGHAYIGNPLGSWSFNDVATDDAVSNDPNNNYRRMATGQWRSNNNPMDRWQYLRASVQYINLFIEIVDDVNWASDPLVAEMFRDRMKGDAYGMRALYMYHLLLNHAGWTEDGRCLGIPILTHSETVTSDFNIPRNTLQECIEQIYADVDSATTFLPVNYGEISNDNLVPVKYQAKGVTAAQYSRVFGDQSRNRMSGAIAEAIRAQATLLAASPAYSEGVSYTWENAAQQMAIVLSRLGANPVSLIDPTGLTWYANATDITNTASGVNVKEILWRGNREENSSLEVEHFPPSLFGSGRVNPTQNLVDAFPMANGYPITSPESGYNPQSPYTDRDPRLSNYIIYNGSTAGNQNSVITTANDGTTNDALGRAETSTRTGYYMKKLLRQDVNANPSSIVNQFHYKPFIRFTEIFLSYAEAANEAWGPTGTGGNSYSAYDVIKAIRARAGVGTTNGDAYLESVKGDKDAMRTLIHNERRLELCFEGHRFWDLRRWKEPIADPAKGMRIEAGSYSPISNVEARSYADYMYYGPIPYDETLKFNALIQNKGW